ncbi:hypothetical protein EYS14_02575 [Alteromonadaceae bacterium M269]|nr:hypothetical protein EYS14_02575 [Alteromonadaceae bacterium M269]
MHFIAQGAGLVGAAFVLCAYFMISQKKWSEGQVRYHLFNILGAGLILFSLTFDFNIAAFVIQVFWIVIGFLGLYRLKNKES